MLSQDAEVGVNLTWKRGCFTSHSLRNFRPASRPPSSATVPGAQVQWRREFAAVNQAVELGLAESGGHAHHEVAAGLARLAAKQLPPPNRRTPSESCRCSCLQAIQPDAATTPQGCARAAVGNRPEMATDGEARRAQRAEIPRADVRSASKAAISPSKAAIARTSPTRQTARKGRLNFLYLTYTSSYLTYSYTFAQMAERQ